MDHTGFFLAIGRNEISCERESKTEHEASRATGERK